MAKSRIDMELIRRSVADAFEPLGKAINFEGDDKFSTLLAGSVRPEKLVKIPKDKN